MVAQYELIETPFYPACASVRTICGTHFEEDPSVSTGLFGQLSTSDKGVPSSDSLPVVSLLPGLELWSDCQGWNWYPCRPPQLQLAQLQLQHPPPQNYNLFWLPVPLYSMCSQLLCMHPVTVPMTVAVHAPSPPPPMWLLQLVFHGRGWKGSKPPNGLTYITQCTKWLRPEFILALFHFTLFLT